MKFIDALPRIVRRFITIMILAAIGLFLLFGVIANFAGSAEPPSRVDAPWMVETSSIIFYASEITSNNGIPAIRGYWVHDGFNYRYYDSVQEFKKEEWGTINIIRRH